MKNLSEEQLAEQRRLRNISDYIHSCIRRIENHLSLIALLKKNKRLYAKQHQMTTLSLCDVYSRDITITLNQIIDEDLKTSSLFSLVDSISRPRKKKEFYARLKLIKADLNPLVQRRSNVLAHFNTKQNVFEKGRFHIQPMYSVVPREVRRMLKEVESFYWDVKEELKIEGLLVFYSGNLADDFENWLPEKRK